MNIVLVGPMASGKTTVGSRLAQRLGLPFVDADRYIEETTGREISEIFQEYGEPHFRKLEEETIEKLSLLQNVVIAAGGGAVISEKNRRVLSSRCTVITLMAPAEEILDRVGADSSRPLIAGPDRLRRIQDLLDKRREYYLSCGHVIDTTGLSIEDVVTKIIEFLESGSVSVSGSVSASASGVAGECTGRHSGGYNGGNEEAPGGTRVLAIEASSPYPIYIGTGLLDSTGRILADILAAKTTHAGAGETRPPGIRTLIISNPVVNELYGERIRDSLIREGFVVDSLTIGDGEEFKNLGQVTKVYDFMAAKRMKRDTLVLALGGGVVGDLAGFVAATYMRGVRFLQLPTTMLAQVDSSVGGKVAVNHAGVKNLVGAFHQPAGVVADVATLKSLPDREYKEGLAEVIKHGIICDREFFEFLERNVRSILHRQPDVLTEMIYTSCRIKGDVVRRDERENGLRMILNFGHTIGHAIEAATGYQALRHGEAVSIGMVMAMDIACRLGLMSAADRDRAAGLLGACDLPTSVNDIEGPSGIDADTLASYMALDKKARGDKIKFVFATRIGEASIHEIAPGEIHTYLAGVL